MSAVAGQAASGRYFALSTECIAPRERRVFWRDTVLDRSDADFPPDAGSHEFSASALGYISDAAELREGRSGAVTLRRDAARCRQDGGDELLLSAIVSTDRPAMYRSGDVALKVPAGRILVNDLSIPFAIDLARYRSINFRLPRAAVSRDLGLSPACLSGRLLAETPLVTLLFSQLTRVADALPTMDDAARRVALDATADFALATLRLETSVTGWQSTDGAANDDETRWRGLWAAAHRFIERHIHRGDLNPDMVARALSCSRTQLYRAFTHHDMTVMDRVREIRLNRCRDLLADRNCDLPIAEIAALHGLDNASAFGRGFRRRFGCTPGELRRSARERPM
jgi:AraC family transcriptional regulator, positive regulator of tynA and feaB